MKRTVISQILTTVLLSVAVAACSTSTQSTDTTAFPTTTLNGPSRTTVPWKPGAALKAWDKWVKNFETIDVSGVSKSDCGVFGMIVTEGSLTFYMWNGLTWIDISKDLAGGHGQKPEKVYTQDFTNDGVLDFFVIYGDNRAKGGASYGAYFAFPWTSCEWKWVGVDNGNTIAKTVESPEVDQRKRLVYAKGFFRGYGSFGAINYLPSTSSFVFTQVFKK